jgi:ABC-type nitrate/sulfonate/bicarbonate transport system ATPase subunit
VIGLALQGIRRRFAAPVPRDVLDGVDLSIGAGEFVALVGPSGRGKTTLLRIIGGLDPGYQGRIDWPDGPPRRRAAVFQDPRLVPWLGLLDNLLLVAGRAAEPEARALLAAVELASREDAWPGQLSGGMQRRAALARALLVEPDLLLLDEPLVSLDHALAGRMRALLAEYWRRHRPTVLLVTHDLREAVTLADRVVVLAEGAGRVSLQRGIELPHPRDPADPRIDAIVDALLRFDPGLAVPAVEEDGEADRA